MAHRSLVLSCEHASGRVPSAYEPLFAPEAAVRALQSHRGLDFGARQLATAIARAYGCPAFFAEVTRLLIDLNRSPHHRQLFSEFTRALPDAERRSLLERYYLPYRASVERALQQQLQQSPQVVHLSVHSFTPRFAGQVRRAHIGLLYDPSRRAESKFAGLFASNLKRQAPELSVRRNYPYRGVSDGFTRWLRQRFASNRYLGIELEVNQCFFEQGASRARRRELFHCILAALPVARGQAGTEGKS